ncbi:monooxygenase [Aspergillus sclerotiicarbonarius CBS 121057]|uniref:Monooxygenase n=1 Tax=Aspergillus sclerotiicarbonarius (strain CBS 121057 / IBT 28362) TaxID=1448318 RepID=A0A319F4W2_ASPSB|nr:monooxygenase [Aspergillus sclerotiicarbonarius CBS 121057]
MPLKILITGAGIAGTTLTYFLSHLHQKHSITVLERAPALRDSGLQIDLRGPGIQVLRRMGLEDAFRAISVSEQGLGLVDGKGRRWGYFPVNSSGKGLQSFSTDWEVMRGDLTRMLYGESLKGEGVRYEFGVWVEEIQETGGEVEVLLSDGRKETFDLLIGADGLGSRMRGLMLGGDGDGKEAVHELGVYTGYFTVEKEMGEGEGYDATVYIATKGRGIMTRRHEKDRYLAYLSCRVGGEMKIARGKKGDVEQDKQILRNAFRGAGWRTEELLQAMEEADDFYCECMGVVNLDRWSRGRIVLVGDAAYCPSAMTGMGTSSAMAGVYVLAGEIGRACAGDGATVTTEDIEAALARYEEKLRPFMNHVQRGLLDNNDYMARFPSSAFGVGVMYFLFAMASFFRLDVLARWVLREDTNGWELPDYPDVLGN